MERFPGRRQIEQRESQITTCGECRSGWQALLICFAAGIVRTGWSIQNGRAGGQAGKTGKGRAFHSSDSCFQTRRNVPTSYVATFIALKQRTLDLCGHLLVRKRVVSPRALTKRNTKHVFARGITTGCVDPPADSINVCVTDSMSA